MSALDAQRRTPVLAIVAAGFGATVAMWTVGYVCRIPPVLVPAPVMLVLMIGCLVAAGAWAGRNRGPGARAGAVTVGAMVGLTSAVLNLLVIGSVIGGADAEGLVPSAALWGPGSILVSVVAGSVGAWLGARWPRAQPLDVLGWRTAFLVIATLATLLVVIAGGLVTSLEAGLAVPDWPNTYGSNMFLYPLARMTGGIYYEHAHRLYGALVGLTTIVVAATLWCTDDRRWLKWVAIGAVVLVVAQGIMGGLRVTGTLTMSQDVAELAPRIELAVVHGVTGQIFFAWMMLMLAFGTRLWRTAPRAAPSLNANTDRSLALTLAVVLVLQLILGALYRHLATDDVPLPWPAMLHFALAAVAALLCYLTGLRLWAIHADQPVLPRLGRALAIAVTLQLVLGVVALVFVMAARPGWAAYEVILATLHQANGALLLALAVQASAWTRRLLMPVPTSAIRDLP